LHGKKHLHEKKSDSVSTLTTNSGGNQTDDIAVSIIDVDAAVGVNNTPAPVPIIVDANAPDSS
jgi:hypothetical protein